MGTYKQLTYEQRYQLYTFLKAGFCQSEITATIGTHRSTISRELKRNQEGRGYRPKQAQRFAAGRQNIAKTRINPEEWKLVKVLIGLDWSPEQISDYCRDNQIMHISHEWIYQYIYNDKRDDGSISDVVKSVMAAMKNGANPKSGMG